MEPQTQPLKAYYNEIPALDRQDVNKTNGNTENTEKYVTVPYQNTNTYNTHMNNNRNSVTIPAIVSSPRQCFAQNYTYVNNGQGSVDTPLQVSVDTPVQGSVDTPVQDYVAAAIPPENTEIYIFSLAEKGEDVQRHENRGIVSDGASKYQIQVQGSDISDEQNYVLVPQTDETSTVLVWEEEAS